MNKPVASALLFLAINLSAIQSVYPAQPSEYIDGIVESPNADYIPYGPKSKGIDEPVIDAETSVYGLPWHSTVEQTYEYFGKPSGVIRPSPERIILIYGKSHALIFSKNLLTGLKLTDSVLDWSLSGLMEGGSYFDVGWTISPGITKGMKKERVSKLIGKDIPDDSYEWSFKRGKANIKLNFSSSSGLGLEKSYTVYAAFITVENVAPEPYFAGKEKLLDQLKELSVQDEATATKILWQLINCPLSSDEELVLIRFLDSSNPNVFNAAMSLLNKSKNLNIADKLRRIIKDTDAFRAFTATTVLFESYNDTESMKLLLSRLLDSNSGLDFRRDLISRFESPKDIELIDALLDLLSDTDMWIRYHSFHMLKKQTGNSFDYNFRVDPQHQVESLTKWRDWWKSRRDTYIFNVGDVVYGGIGATIVAKGAYPIITKLFPNMGAAKAGLKEGDIILEVNGESTKGKPVTGLSRYEILGDPGTNVTLTIKDPYSEEVTSVIIMRRKFSY